jgi:hypothetical protein
MELRELLRLCQYGDHSHEWVRVPGGPSERMPTGFIDVASDDQPPALAALQPNYLAVYHARPERHAGVGLPLRGLAGGTSGTA